MFVSPEFFEGMMQLASDHMALRYLLITKGIIDYPELLEVESRCLAQMDQHRANQREEFLKQNPQAAMIDRLMN